MNARIKTLQLTVDSRQLKDTALCVFHTLLLHRTSGKYHYDNDLDYKVGSIGLQEVLCEEIDLSYVRVNSPELCINVDKEVSTISDAVSTVIRSGGFTVGSSPQSMASSPSQSVRNYGIDKWESLLTTQMKLEFYQKQHRQWSLRSDDLVPWEVWDLNLEVVRIESAEGFLRMREYVGEKLGEMVLTICQSVNKAQYMPPIPKRDSIGDVFNDSFADCEPYLFRIQSNLTAKQPVGSTRSLEKLIFDTIKFSW